MELHPDNAWPMLFCGGLLFLGLTIYLLLAWAGIIAALENREDP